MCHFSPLILQISARSEALLDHTADFLKFISSAQSFWFSLNTSYDHGCHLASPFRLDPDQYEALLIVAGLALYARFGFQINAGAWRIVVAAATAMAIAMATAAALAAMAEAEKATAALAAAGSMTAMSDDDDDDDNDDDVRRRATAMADAARACSNRRRGLIGSWVTPPTTGAIEIERGGDENITINHGCRQGEAGRQAARRRRRAARQ